MRFLIQRVSKAEVVVNNCITGSIQEGFLVLVGLTHEDTKEVADVLIKKLLQLRIFSDENDKINLSLSDTNGRLLIVSQFTLYADCRKGNRPSFVKAMEPGKANELYEYIVHSVREKGFHVETGEFGADMKVSLLNDGPFTVLLDSDELLRK